MIGKSVVGDVLEDKGAKLFGFELADAHGVWHEAKASIENDSIILDKSGIEEPRAEDMLVTLKLQKINSGISIINPNSRHHLFALIGAL